MIEKEPQVGLPCVVRYTVDNSFYRSEITKLDDRTAEILFVDYGNSQKTPLGNVRRMDSKFMGLPQMVTALFIQFFVVVLNRFSVLGLEMPSEWRSFEESCYC